MFGIFAIIFAIKLNKKLENNPKYFNIYAEEFV